MTIKSIAPQDATLLDVLIDGFEKNEILDGAHWRELPMPDEAAAAEKFAAFVDEARRWKGQPARHDGGGPRRIAVWPDLELRQCGRGIIARVRAPWFMCWNAAVWRGEPMDAVYEWLEEEDGRREQ